MAVSYKDAGVFYISNYDLVRLRMSNYPYKD